MKEWKLIENIFDNFKIFIDWINFIENIIEDVYKNQNHESFITKNRMQREIYFNDKLTQII